MCVYTQHSRREIGVELFLENPSGVSSASLPPTTTPQANICMIINMAGPQQPAHGTEGEQGKEWLPQVVR